MKIQTKLILSILLASLVLVAALYFLLQWSVDRGVLSYVNQRQIERFEPVIDGLQSHYEQHQDWQIFANNPREFGQLLGRYDAQSRREMAGPRGPKRQPSSRRDGFDRPPPPNFNNDEHFDRRHAGPGSKRPRGSRPGRQEDIGLLNASKQPVVPSPRKSTTMLPIIVDGTTVGWLVFRTAGRLTNDYELDFLEQLQETLLLICLVVFALALLIAYPLARHLTMPLATLEQSTARLASGDFSQRIDLNRTDEFGSLQRSFNELAATLEESDRSRKRWLADTSHELRTPLSIARAQIGAMIDDVRPLNKQQLQVALTQIEHLQRLMDDLHELSNADIGGLRYSKTSVDVAQLVAEAVEPHKPRFKEHNVSLSVYPSAQQAYVFADPSRLHQLLDNLLHNSLKYTNSGGKVRFSWVVDEQAQNVIISVEDSEPGVPEPERQRLFDYLYRTESSRNRETGGSGLGLSICKRIVEAHHGVISAAASEFGGLKIDVRLPMEE